MGIASIFKGIGTFFKNGGVKKLIERGVDLYRKTAPHFKKAIDGGSKFLIKLPEYMDKGKRIYDGGKGLIKEITDTLPDGRAKDKINDAMNRIDNKVNNITDKGYKLINGAQQRILPIMGGAGRVIDKLNGYATDFNNH